MGLGDKAKHRAESAKGKVKEGAGRATGDPELKGSGKDDQAAASVKRARDKVKDAAREVKGAARRDTSR